MLCTFIILILPTGRRNLARLASPPASTHILRGEKARQARNLVLNPIKIKSTIKNCLCSTT